MVVATPKSGVALVLWQHVALRYGRVDRAVAGLKQKVQLVLSSIPQA